MPAFAQYPPGVGSFTERRPYSNSLARAQKLFASDWWFQVLYDLIWSYMISFLLAFNKIWDCNNLTLEAWTIYD